MWLKIGTRGDPRVIYLIIIFLVFLGLRSAYYGLYDLNNGPEKQRLIVREVDMVMPINDKIKLQSSKITEHIGGGRELEETLFSDLSKSELYNLFLKNAENNNWKSLNNCKCFVKDNMKMQFEFVDIEEYNNAKHLRDKTIYRIKLEIE